VNRRVRVAAIATLCGAPACNALFGVDGLEFEAADGAGGSATASASSSNGSAAGGGTESGSTTSSAGGCGGGDCGGGGGAGGGGAGGAKLPPWPTAPFGMPVPVAELNDAADDDDPSLTDDLLEIYFNSNRSGNSEVWRSTRSSPIDTWTAPELVVELNSSDVETTPNVSADGLLMYLSSSRGGDVDVYRSTRASRSADWSTPVRVDELNDLGLDVDATEAADGLTLRMASVRTGSQEIYRTTRSDKAAMWAPLLPVIELNSPAADGGLWMRPDGLVAVFASNRAGGGGSQINLWQALRADAGMPFGAPTPIVELNTVESDQDPWASTDGTLIYFARNGEILRATR
jgi:hypothetical protein